MAKAPIVREGDILASKYRVERVLGAGGMGVVVAARHLQLDETVAIKLLLPEVLDVPDVVTRFLREARAAIRIKNDHVARVMDVGVLDNGQPFMVMELLQGKDLADVLKERGPLSAAETVDYVLQACEAIADAHVLRIVHRDLKPANLFLTRKTDGSPHVKVLDFGISKTAGDAGGGEMRITKTAAVMGSPLYMAPEQMRSSRDVDMRADLWSIGAILYELLTGRVPYPADNLPQLCALIVEGPPTPLQQLRPDLPEGLCQAVMRCLQKDPDARFRSVAELALAIAPFGSRSARASASSIKNIIQAGGLSSSALDLPPSSDEIASPAGTLTDFANSNPSPRSRGRTSVLIATAVGTVVVASIAVVLVVQGARSDPTAPAPGLSVGANQAAASADFVPIATSASEPVAKQPTEMPVVASATAATPASAKPRQPSKPPAAATPAPPRPAVKPGSGDGLDKFNYTQ